MKKKIIYRFLQAPLLCVIILFLSISSYASEYRLLPTDDAFVTLLAPTMNYGAANYLHLSGWENSTNYIYLKFQLDVILEDEVLSGATLNLFSFYGAFTWVNLHHIADDSWNEFETTWSNKPNTENTGSLLDTSYLNYPSNWLAWDLFASGEWNCVADLEDSYLSLLIKLESNHDIIFFSKETVNGSFMSPFLELTTISINTETDTAAVPIPSTIWLFLSCLLMFKFGNAKR